MPLTFASGLEFLNVNKDADKWFLQIETYDPHEPFYVSERFRELYKHDYNGLPFDHPSYEPVVEKPDEIDHVRREYMALVSMCDEKLGLILDFMDAHDMWKDTMLIVNTDHGFLLSEHGWWGKCFQPYYEEISHMPLFVWDPRLNKQGERRDSLVQTIDIAPTLLDFFGLDIPKDMEGKPLTGVIEKDAPIREAALFGQHGSQICVTDGRSVYMRACATVDNTPLYDYTQMATYMKDFIPLEKLRGVELSEPFDFTKGCRLMKIESKGFNVDALGRIEMPEEMRKAGGPKAEIFRTMLFDLKNDPEQQRPISDPEQEKRMIRLMLELMQKNDAPIEQYIRMGLPVPQNKA